jgi:hypothetical protein
MGIVASRDLGSDEATILTERLFALNLRHASVDREIHAGDV